MYRRMLRPARISPPVPRALCIQIRKETDALRLGEVANRWKGPSDWITVRSADGTRETEENREKWRKESLRWCVFYGWRWGREISSSLGVVQEQIMHRNELWRCFLVQAHREETSSDERTSVASRDRLRQRIEREKTKNESSWKKQQRLSVTY